MIDCFCPTLASLFVSEHKNINFFLFGFTLFPSSQVVLSGITIGVNIVCTLLLTGIFTLPIC